jgi:hypothetical protein
MAALLDPQHELFAVHYASGACSAGEAARLAGFAKSRGYNSGARLMKRPEVAARVAELQEHTVAIVKADKERHPDPSSKYVARPWVIFKTVKLEQLARESSNLNVSYSCLRLLAQMGGHLEPQTPKGPTTLTQNNFNTMTPKQLRDMLAETVKDLPAAQRQQLLQSADVSDVIDITAADAVDVDSLLG